MNRKLVKGSRFFFLSGWCVSVRYNIQFKDIGATPIFPTMNDEQTLSFAYICGKNHGKVEITPEQLNQVMKILYG